MQKMIEVLYRSLWGLVLLGILGAAALEQESLEEKWVLWKKAEATTGWSQKKAYAEFFLKFPEENTIKNFAKKSSCLLHMEMTQGYLHEGLTKKRAGIDFQHEIKEAQVHWEQAKKESPRFYLWHPEAVDVVRLFHAIGDDHYAGQEFAKMYSLAQEIKKNPGNSYEELKKERRSADENPLWRKELQLVGEEILRGLRTPYIIFLLETEYSEYYNPKLALFLAKEIATEVEEELNSSTYFEILAAAEAANDNYEAALAAIQRCEELSPNAYTSKGRKKYDVMRERLAQNEPFLYLQ